MGAGSEARRDNTKTWFGATKKVLPETRECLVTPDNIEGSNGRTVHYWSLQLDSSMPAELAPRSRGKATDAEINRVKKKLCMDGESLLRSKGTEMRKLKAARAKNATRWKGTALKAKEKALGEQQRARNICTAELGKEVEALKASKSLVEKGVVRSARRVECS
jgi:hypothetical protein